TGAANSCPSGWLTYNKSCYKIFLKAKTWNDAERFCRAQKTGCHLASIHDAEEFNRLAWYGYWYLIFRNIWIGLKDPKKKRVWEWSNGSRMNYQDWAEEKTNKAWRDDECVELQSWL
ncbi:C-type lectin-like, partial [Python bivittatus]|uniref:C-type lectin-like n=1 Tax=Python bivittatus TaxID=176946 RepID=A0A9F2WM79_PYTBI